MKKNLSIVGFVFLILLLTGCGSKKLVCEQSYSEKAHEIYTFEFTKAGVLKSVSLRRIAKGYIEGELTAYERAELNSECDDVTEEGVNNLNCKVNIKGKDVEMIISATGIDKMSLEEIEKADLEDFADSTYEELKKEFVEEGYTCK